MLLLWKASYPGIYIDQSAAGDNAKTLGIVEGAAFASATRRALDRIASKPIGKDLLILIAKRCKGIGNQLVGGKVTIRYGTGTLTPGRVSARKTLMGGTGAGADSDDDGDRSSDPLRVLTSKGVVNLGITRASKGSSGGVTYNPFLSVGDVYIHQQLRSNLRALIGVDTPAFVALAHELCHALHALSGDAKAYPFPEEAWTIGAGKYADTRISENAIRREHGVELRRFYFQKGDCD
jgi:hypothetical protein